MADENNLNEELGERIIPINIEDEMKTAYIDYSMSVIVSRALPDVRDGLKPVHRRVLYGMTELGLASNRSYKKSARIVGEVLGKYHPHGDTSVYDAMVRMAQDWSLRYPFVDGQGNFGSMDGDPPAAMRYTEARMRKIAEEMMTDIDKNTVDFRGNFDDSLQEPTVMPAKIPALLVNGASGIAVGMATNMAPHNLREVVDGIKAYIDNNDITTEELMEHVKGPDFPTGGTIYGFDGIKDAYETGRGRVVVRGKAEFDVTKTGREQIIITEIPYQVNPSNLIIKAAELVNEKVIEGISDIRDESSRHGLRVVFDLKKDAIPNIILNQLYKYTQLQTSFSINSIALVKGRPMMLTLKDLILHFVDHRHEVVVRRTKYDLEEAQKRAHILEGLLIALDHLDEVIALIRASVNPEEARNGLIEKFGLSELQARAILDMRLQRLTGLERDKIRLEYDELMKHITDLEDILSNEPRRMQIIKDELDDMKHKFGDDRRTDIVHTSDDISIEDMIPDENVVITISHLGYIKRTALTEYRVQHRGGRGNKGATARDADFVEQLFIASTHNYMLFFTEQGKCFWMKVYEIPEGARATKGRAIQNLINIAPDDKIRAFINVDNLKDEEYLSKNYIIMCTKNGIIKKTTLEAYSRPRQNGINAVTVRDGDVLLEAQLTDNDSEILIAKKSGKAIRFSSNAIRPMGRTASGVKGVTLDGAKDEVIGMICVNPSNQSTTILVVSEKGFGKRTNLVDPESGEDVYRVTGRGGKGVKTLSVTEKTGSLIAIKDVTEEHDIMIILKSGIAIRMSMENLRVTGRATQGVRLIKMGKNDEIASVAVVEHEDEEEEIEGMEGVEGVAVDSVDGAEESVLLSPEAVTNHEAAEDEEGAEDDDDAADDSEDDEN